MNPDAKEPRLRDIGIELLSGGKKGARLETYFVLQMGVHVFETRIHLGRIYTYMTFDVSVEMRNKDKW